MQAYGFPVGPMTLMDEVGLDVAFHVAKDLGKALGYRVSSGDTRSLEDLMEKKCLGRKSGKRILSLFQEKSFDIIGKSKGKQVNPDAISILAKYKNNTKDMLSREDIQKRLTYRMVNEAVQCLQMGFYKNPVEGDIGAVFWSRVSPFSRRTLFAFVISVVYSL